MILALLLLLCLLPVPCLSLTGAASANGADTNGHGSLDVRVTDLRNSRGTEVCTLFDASQAKAFPEDSSRALRTVTVPIESATATCHFDGIAAGRYAIVTFHDENNNRQFDRDSLGLPLEQYGFSNSLRPKFARPTFKQAAFDYTGGEQWMTIRLAN
jgi:uncharacterized protein (DUF2141 family)